MICRMVVLRLPLERLFDRFKIFEKINQNEWVVVEELIELLKPFKDATVYSSGQYVATLSAQIWWYEKLREVLKKKMVSAFIIFIKVLSLF